MLFTKGELLSSVTSYSSIKDRLSGVCVSHTKFLLYKSVELVSTCRSDQRDALFAVVVLSYLGSSVYLSRVCASISKSPLAPGCALCHRDKTYGTYRQDPLGANKQRE
jgi:hypothetical protein